MLYFNKGGLQENHGWVTDDKTFLSSDELYTHCQRNSATQSQVQFGSCNCIYQRHEWQLSWLHTTLLWGKVLYLHKFSIRILCLWRVWNSARMLCLLLLVVYDSLQGHGHRSLSHKFTKPQTFSYAFFVISYLPPSVCQCHGHLSDSFPFSLGTFAKLWKATISFIMFVCPSIHMEQLSPHYTNFHEIWYLRVFQNSVEKIQVWLKSDKHNGYFAWRPAFLSARFLIPTPWIFSGTKIFFQRKSWKKMKHVVCPVL